MSTQTQTYPVCWKNGGYPIILPHLKTLSLLDNDLVRELIRPIENRAKFLKNLENWKTITDNKPEQEVYTSTHIEFVDLLNPSHKKIQSVSEFLTPTNSNNDQSDENITADVNATTTDIIEPTTSSSDSKLKIKRCAKGKLYDCLQNRRRELREAKVIKKSVTTPSPSLNDTSDNSDEPIGNDVTENCDGDFQWLQNCTEPWHTAVEKW